MNDEAAETPAPSRPQPASLWASPQMTLIVGCLSILALLGVGVTAVFIGQERTYNTCQRGHNDDTVSSLRERAAATDLDRKALALIADSGKNMVDAILLQTGTQADKLLAVQQWRDSQEMAKQLLDDAKAQRDAHPLPAPRVC